MKNIHHYEHVRHICKVSAGMKQTLHSPSKIQQFLASKEFILIYLPKRKAKHRAIFAILKGYYELQ